HKDLAHEAKVKLKHLGCRNIQIRMGDGGLGWEEGSPFDACIISAATPVLPSPLKEQMRMDGVMVYPHGSGFSQTLVRSYKRISTWEEERLFNCVFVPLVGKYGQ
ncbi:MAG: protein-L-isoaspartate(D-aspartate) O-methyltransferase, partial [Chlamydiota bacterium]|nr:protein-L-isoaspartate(D-aspartate) O-methyltransferase [Chlamydiota bacterium]